MYGADADGLVVRMELSERAGVGVGDADNVATDAVGGADKESCAEALLLLAPVDVAYTVGL